MARKRYPIVCCLLVVGMIVSSLGAIFVERADSSGDEIAAHSQASTILFLVHGPKGVLPDGNYSDIVSTGEALNYSVSLPPGSEYTLSQLNITWRIGTELGTTLFSYGSTLRYSYSEIGDYLIDVTLISASDNKTGYRSVVVHVLLDYDADGIADWWEREYFGNSATVDNTTDYDGDGWTDLEEFERGSNPIVVNYYPGFLDNYWWVIVIVAVGLVLGMLFIFVIRPNMIERRKAEEQKKIKAAVEIEKNLMEFEDLDEKKDK